MKDAAILCVDDEMIILLTLLQELKAMFGSRFIYEKATGAQAAFEVIADLAEEGIQVIVIISDWLMPAMKGDEFLEKIHAQYPSIKAIMITGHMDNLAIERVRQNEAVISILSKPWDPDELKTSILSVCEV